MPIDAKGVLGGLFGSDGLLLPMNSIIRDYGMLDGQTFKVKVRALQPKPIELFPNSDGMDTKKDANPEIVVFEVFYSADSITINHAHSWGDSMVGGMVKTAAQAAGKIGLSSLVSMANAAANKKPVISGVVRQDSWMDVDVAPIYQGTAGQKLDLTFYLVAHDDPLKEVVIPAQILTYLTYPKLQVDSSALQLIAKYVSEVSGLTGDALNKATANILKDLENNKDIPAALKDAILTAVQIAGRFSGQPGDQIASSFRLRFGSPPPIWQISCSNGSLFMISAHVSNLSVTYYGPWLSSKSQASLLKDIGTALASGKPGLSSIASIYPSASVLGMAGNGLMDMLLGSNKGGYPSYAEITMSFESNFTSVFGEEWLLSLNPSLVTTKTA